MGVATFINKPSTFFMGLVPIFARSSLSTLIKNLPPVWLTVWAPHGSPPARGWTAAGGLWRSAPAHWLDRWQRSTAGSSWMPRSSQHRSHQIWGCTGPFSLFSRNGRSCLPPHSWRKEGEAWSGQQGVQKRRATNTSQRSWPANTDLHGSSQFICCQWFKLWL